MRRYLILAMVTLLVSGGAFAMTYEEKLLLQEQAPDYSNDFQVPPSTASVPQITEDFEGGTPPAGWTVTDNAGDGIIWEGAPCGDLTGNWTGGTGDYACANSDFPGSGLEYDTELITESYNFCDSVNSGLTFQANYINLVSTDTFQVDCSADGGGSWNTYLEWHEDHGGFKSLPGEDVSLDISDLDGSASVICRFWYYDPATNDWNWYVQVDNVVFESDGVISTPGVDDCGGGGVPATTGIGLVLMVLALGGSSAYFLRRK
jgi:hypothetical protein